MGPAAHLRCPGEHNTDGADMWSKGKDKQDGNADDIRSWMRMDEQCKK